MEVIDLIEKHEDEGLELICPYHSDEEALFHYSSDKKDDYFNRVRRIRSQNHMSLLARVKDFYTRIDANPAIIVNPLTLPADLAQILSDANYDANERNVGFCYSKNLNIAPERLRAVQVEQITEPSKFVKVYSKIFSKIGESRELLNQRISSNLSRGPHLISLENDKPTGIIGSVGFNDVYVIYGFGVLPDKRGAVIGKLLCSRILEILRETNSLIYFKSFRKGFFKTMRNFGFEFGYTEVALKMREYQ